MYKDYREFEKEENRRTIVSFDPFFRREDVRGLTDAAIGKKFGLPTQTVKNMRKHLEVPFDTIRALCHQLKCQPGDILDAMTMYHIPAKTDIEK